MTVYFVLIGYILLIPFVIKAFIKDPVKQKTHVLAASLIAIFLVFALKAPSVGRDILGYQKMYNSFRYASWSNYTQFYWTETGFEFLEMVFSKILGFDFQAFAAILYGFICYSYYCFVKRYSDNVTLSLIIYICFGFFVFDLSGIRFALSLAISLFAFPLAQKQGIKNAVGYFAIVLLSAQIHRGAYICILLFFVIHYPFKGWKRFFYIAFPAILILGKGFLNPLVALFTNIRLESNVFIGGNVVFYVFMLALVFIVNFLWKQTAKSYDEEQKQAGVFAYKNIGVQTRLFYIGIAMVVALGESTAGRLANYGLFFMIPLLPDVVSLLNKRSRIVIIGFLYTFLLAYFVAYKIIPNELDMGPYIAFWNY